MVALMNAVIGVLVIVSSLLSLSAGKKEDCPNVAVGATKRVELGTSIELNDSTTIDSDDIKFLAAHLPNETVKTIANCQNINGEYNCSKHDEDMYAMKIEDMSISIKSFISASGILHTNTSLIIYNASEGQPSKICFVYEFMRNGNIEPQSTEFTVNFTHKGRDTTPQPTEGRGTSPIKNSSGLWIKLTAAGVGGLIIIGVVAAIYFWRRRSPRSMSFNTDGSTTKVETGHFQQMWSTGPNTSREEITSTLSQDGRYLSVNP